MEVNWNVVNVDADVLRTQRAEILPRSALSLSRFSRMGYKCQAGFTPGRTVGRVIALRSQSATSYRAAISRLRNKFFPASLAATGPGRMRYR